MAARLPLVLLAVALFATGCRQPPPAVRWEDHAVLTWAEKLAHADPWVRAGAADALGRLGPAAAGTRGLLLNRFRQDESAEVRARCARALGQVGATEAKADLLATFQGPADEKVRLGCAEAVVALGAGAEFLDLLLSALDARPDSETLQALATGFGAIGEPAVEPLRRRLSPVAPSETRTSAALCLGAIGRPARTAVIELRALLEESEDPLRLAAILALGSIGGPEACQALAISYQSDPSPGLRVEAVIAGASSCDFATARADAD